jgi:hypothetical protein
MKDPHIPVEEAAKLMKKSPQFIRIGLQRGLLPFGFAVPISKKRWSYYVIRSKFYEALGIQEEEET